MLVYHGTDKIFDHFDPEMTGRINYGPGSYFTNDVSVANRYGHRVLEVSIKDISFADASLLDRSFTDINGLKVNQDNLDNYPDQHLYSINDIFYIASSYKDAVDFLKSRWGFGGVEIDMGNGVVYYTVWDTADIVDFKEINVSEYWHQYYKFYRDLAEYVDSCFGVFSILSRRTPLVLALQNIKYSIK